MAFAPPPRCPHATLYAAPPFSMVQAALPLGAGCWRVSPASGFLVLLRAETLRTSCRLFLRVPSPLRARPRPRPPSCPGSSAALTWDSALAVGDSLS
ncbi:unnamed protein product [Caretta caretta]